LVKLAVKMQNKRAKIVRAAQTLFRGQGFDATTMSQIATRAKVATGTLFLYADSKRDLLFMSMNAGFKAASSKAFQVPVADDLIEQLLAFFRPFYEFYDSDRSIASTLLREILFFQSGQHAAESAGLVVALKSDLRRRLESPVVGSTLRADISPVDMAELLFGIFQIEVRRWVAGSSPLDEGLSRLGHLLRLAMEGLQKRDAQENDRPATAGARKQSGGPAGRR
jgi:AcrR family transcriptional regulator